MALNSAYGGRTGLFGFVGIAVGEYAAPVFVQHANVTPAVTAIAYFMPIQLPPGFVCDQLAFNLQTVQVGAECRIGLYDNNPDTGLPENLIHDGGIFDLSATTGLRTAAISPAKRLPTRVWSCVFLKNVATQATMSGNNNTLGNASLGNASGFITGGSNTRGVQITAAYTGAALPAKAVTIGAFGRSASVTFPFVFPRRA